MDPGSAAPSGVTESCGAAVILSVYRALIAPRTPVTPGRRAATNPGSIFSHVRRRGPRIGFAVRGDGIMRGGGYSVSVQSEDRPAIPRHPGAARERGTRGPSFHTCGGMDPGSAAPSGVTVVGGAAVILSVYRAMIAPRTPVTPGRRAATNPGSIFWRPGRGGPRVLACGEPRGDGVKGFDHIFVIG